MKKKQIEFTIFIQMSGYEVIETDCKSNKGIKDLRRILKNNSSAFAGQSGVRKIYTYKSNFRR